MFLRAKYSHVIHVLKEAQLALSGNKKVAILRVITEKQDCLKVYQAQRVKILLSNVGHAPSESYSYSICNHLELSTW